MLAEPSKSLKRAAGRCAPIWNARIGTSAAALCHAHQDSDCRYDKNSRRGGDHGHNLLLPVGVRASFSPLN
jgi:hypothetical protein